MVGLIPLSASSSILAVRSLAAAVTAASICSASLAAPLNWLNASIAKATPPAIAEIGPSIPINASIPLLPPLSKTPPIAPNPSINSPTESPRELKASPITPPCADTIAPTPLKDSPTPLTDLPISDADPCTFSRSLCACWTPSTSTSITTLFSAIADLAHLSFMKTIFQ